MTPTITIALAGMVLRSHRELCRLKHEIWESNRKREECLRKAREVNMAGDREVKYETPEEFEQVALENLRDVVRGVICARKRRTGYFDEAQAWVDIENALSACK